MTGCPVLKNIWSVRYVQVVAQFQRSALWMVRYNRAVAATLDVDANQEVLRAC